MQYDSPLGFDIQDPSCRQGDGEHDIKPENSKQKFYICFDSITKTRNESISIVNLTTVPVNINSCILVDKQMKQMYDHIASNQQK